MPTKEYKKNTKTEHSNIKSSDLENYYRKFIDFVVELCSPIVSVSVNDTNSNFLIAFASNTHQTLLNNIYPLISNMTIFQSLFVILNPVLLGLPSLGYESNRVHNIDSSYPAKREVPISSYPTTVPGISYVTSLTPSFRIMSFATIIFISYLLLRIFLSLLRNTIRSVLWIFRIAFYVFLITILAAYLQQGYSGVTSLLSPIFKTVEFILQLK